MAHNWRINSRILQNIMEDLSESTTEQIEFIEYLLQVKYQELEANQKLEHKMASEFKVTPMTHSPLVMDILILILENDENSHHGRSHEMEKLFRSFSSGQKIIGLGHFSVLSWPGIGLIWPHLTSLDFIAVNRFSTGQIWPSTRPWKAGDDECSVP